MKKLLLIFIICILVILTDMLFFEPNFLLVKQKSLYLPFWDKQLDGFKISVISDLHIGTHFVGLNKLNKIIQKSNSYEPDLVVLLGDIDAVSVSSSGINPESITGALNNLKSKYGVISVLGNHDYEPEGIVKNIINNANITLLENTDKYICNNRIRIVGFKDLWHHYLNTEKIIGKKNRSSIIVLAHNPDSFYDMPDYVSLTLSGHTHGGEVYLPFIGSPFVPSKYGQRYRKGYIVENNRHLYVSGGVATLSRIRFLNPPEISVLTLYSQNEKSKITNTKPLKGLIKKNYASIVMRIVKNRL